MQLFVMKKGNGFLVPERPDISELTDSDAIVAARLTGIDFNEVVATDYGQVCIARADNGGVDDVFVFSVKGSEEVRIGLHGRLTPNMFEVCDFLSKKYEV